MDIPSAPTPSILRRSCHFCRGRKIRCSGSSICSACQERNIDCVYDVQSGKGRPKGRSSKASAQKEAIAAARAKQAAREDVSVDSMDSTLVKSASPKATNQSQTIEQAMDFMFEENFVEAGPKSANLFQKTISDFSRQLRRDPSHVREICGYPVEELDRADAIPYDSMLSCIRGEMMAMIATRFGNLGCEFKESGSRLSYLRGLLRDTSASMFETPYQGANPLASLDPHRILQLIDTWFSNHPLSPLVSKTLLLTSLKSNTTDTALLAIIVGDALTAHGTSKLYSNSADNEEAFFQYAITLIRSRPATSFKITTVQALCLLGFRELCRYNNRRATCWLGYAGRAVAELDEQMRQGEMRNHQRMNGVEVGTVEREIVRNMHWITFSATFWAMMQIGAPFSAIIPKSLGIDFPPVNESFSAVISLDMASDNISTLLAQSRSLRELWPLSHIVCSMTHICALDPQPPESEDGAHGAAWQSRHLHKLRKLLNFDSEITAVCAQVCDILHEAIQEVEREIQDNFPRSIVICAYRTIIIQLLFPRSNDTIVTLRMVQDFCQAIHGLPEIALSITNSTVTPGPVPRDLVTACPVAETLALCLDACGRGLLRLCERAVSGTDSEYLAVAEYKDQLNLYAAQLHEISKLDLSRTVSFIRPVKRRLKEAKLTFSVFPQLRNRPIRTISRLSTSSNSSQHVSLNMVSTPTAMGDIPAFIPSLYDSAPNSRLGTPVTDHVPLPIYSPELSSATSNPDQSISDGYFSGIDAPAFDMMNQKFNGFIPHSAPDVMKMDDNNTWLYMHQQPEQMVYPERRTSDHHRTSVTSAPSSNQFMNPYSVAAEPTQYVHDETRYW